jgi:threonine/homoserine/homoserine lactone efflux protein
VFGFLVQFPVGPINLTILNEGARRGFKWAVLIGSGAVLMETLYCALAFMG